MESKARRSKGTGSYWVAAILIMVGLLLLGRNLGILDAEVYRLLVSWRMLIAVIGIYFLTKRQYIISFLLIAGGAYLTLDSAGEITEGLTAYFWPAVLVGMGVFFFLWRGSAKKHHSCRHVEQTEFSSGDGYVNVENRMGAIQHIVTDELIKGGTVKNSFGAIALDLRRTSLPEGATYINIDVYFGGVEIYVPSTWEVKSELHPFLGGYEDSRLKGMPINSGSVLILRGDLSFGGIEVKG